MGTLIGKLNIWLLGWADQDRGLGCDSAGTISMGFGHLILAVLKAEDWLVRLALLYVLEFLILVLADLRMVKSCCRGLKSANLEVFSTHQQLFQTDVISAL